MADTTMPLHGRQMEMAGEPLAGPVPYCTVQYCDLLATVLGVESTAFRQSFVHLHNRLLLIA
jgi:hypothetical protein